MLTYRWEPNIDYHFELQVVLEVIAMKGWFQHSQKLPELEPHHQMQFRCYTQDTTFVCVCVIVVGSYPSARDEVGVF